MRKDKYKIQIGDILYEASLMRNKVIEYKIVDIFVESYDHNRGYEVVFVVEGKLSEETRFTDEKFLETLQQWFDTKEEAENELERIRNICDVWNKLGNS